MSQNPQDLSIPCYLSLGCCLIFTGVILFSLFSDYRLQPNYAVGLIVLTILFTVGAIWQIWRSHQSKLLALAGMLVTSLPVIGIGYYLLVILLFPFDDCHISYTSPSHERTIVIRDRCFFDCDSYLYLQWFIFEKEMAKIIDSGGGFCRAHASNETQIQWSADERQIEWTVYKGKGVVWLE